jgi:hypothetical protein
MYASAKAKHRDSVGHLDFHRAILSVSFLLAVLRPKSEYLLLIGSVSGLNASERIGRLVDTDGRKSHSIYIYLGARVKNTGFPSPRAHSLTHTLPSLVIPILVITKHLPILLQGSALTEQRRCSPPPTPRPLRDA